MREIADKGGEGDEGEVAKWPQKILHIISEHEEEIDVADKMQNAAGLYNLTRDLGQLRERECACADD